MSKLETKLFKQYEHKIYYVQDVDLNKYDMKNSLATRTFKSQYQQ